MGKDPHLQSSSISAFGREFSQMGRRALKVAVIGAGAAGLVAAGELLKEGHRVVIFEKGDRLGGIWAYDPRVDTDPLSLDPGRGIIHSSLYLSLRTNIPRQLMGFLGYPFPKRENGDWRAFPGHEEMLWFLNDFASNFGLVEFIRFEREVVRVERVGERKDEWVVESRNRRLGSQVEVFEAVVVCSGHFTEPRIAEIPGMDNWPGKQIHSHNYRIPEPFRDMIVVIIGNGSSATDISREISKVAKEIHLASRAPDIEIGRLDNHDNIWQHSMVDSVYEDGKVKFRDGSSAHADIILHCTGYKFHFPFLETNGIISVDDNRVGPLYKHVFPPSLAPWLSFVGIPSKVIPFLNMELQSKWVAHVLSGKVLLPSEEEMMVSVEELYRHMEETGKPKHYTHVMSPNEPEYMNWLVAEVGLPPLEKWRLDMYREAMKFLEAGHDAYRDEWDEDHWNMVLQSKEVELLTYEEKFPSPKAENEDGGINHKI